MTDRAYAEIFPPGDFLREELEARNWTQSDLAEVLGRSPRLVNEIISAKRAITPETAKGLAEAFGTSAELWMNLESVWQLSKLSHENDAIARRARLYEKYPVKEMIRRGWIESSPSISILESRFMQFFNLRSQDQEPQSAHAFRRRDIDDAPNMLQLAWLFRVRQIASQTPVAKFSADKLATCLDELKSLLPSVEEIRHVPRILANAGIRFVVVEAFPGSGIDGVCCWLDHKNPVIALSLRFDRIDWFWFTLLHEIRHVANGDGKDVVVIDTNLVGENADLDNVSVSELKADKEASDFLIPEEEINNFVARVRPLYSEARVVGFAGRIGVHAGVVVGRLQKMEEIPYSNLRKHLVKIRSFIIPTALTDGWNSTVNVSA
jgi:HTH-type transcriptional regulator/antitoxin HigA